MDTTEVMEIIPNEALIAARQERDAKLARIEVRRIARSLIVPTDDNDVRQDLRTRALPVCLFGEDAHDRRERLRFVIANEVYNKKSTNESNPVSPSVETSNDKNGAKNDHMELTEEDFYTEGQQALHQLRLQIALPSLKRARARLLRQRLLSQNTPSAKELKQRRRAAEEAVVHSVRENYTLASHIGDDRPLSAIAFGEQGETSFVVTGSWSGRVKIWSAATAGQPLQSFDNIHSARVSNVVVPRNMAGTLLTCSADGTGCVLRKSPDNVFTNTLTLRVHEGFRVSDIQMHPFRHSLIGTAAYDGTFALYDDDKLVVQQPTGHDRIYRLQFHPDGSLLATCGLDGGIRVWDLRSGRAVMTMSKAHAEDVLAIRFGGNGHILASGGMDNVFRVWDLRTVRCARTVAAHRALISGMCFGGGMEGDNVFFTSSFDRSVKCWGTHRNWSLLAAHTSYEDKVTAVDCSEDGKKIVAACYDKTWKVWGRDPQP